ncbi:Rhodanese-like protein [Gloeophyllum trabeum ATCC 11539]|uniref:Rhodanese-like protein n=1 Tax=Gloeophyllum trabeum (strain ATCC 11539 / FP-39264 / Madison 617) TaxID=670483 RepID=S7PUU5_GLOTA|nr:Rhodanese-like protein [Gloeophyllum trabeum ATCC 11539]EPQ51067.1 Rhodanese-like protein [Gloeophyllum trabeum ATCC 11539]
MFKYISADELADLIKSPAVPAKDYLVVDVRDDDRAGGHIRGAHNAPSSVFLARVDELVRRTKDVPTVVFHCALSQIRGPKAARIYAETRDALQAGGEDKPHQVYVLRGGFQEFQSKFRHDPELVENWDKDVWDVEYM